MRIPRKVVSTLALLTVVVITLTGCTMPQSALVSAYAFRVAG